MSELMTAADSGTANGGLIDDRAGRDMIKIALDKITKKQPAILTFNKYYYGNHDFNFSSEKFTTEFAHRLHKFRDNLCKTCVKAPADRLEIIGFSSDKKSETYNQSWDIWKYSLMPQVSKRVHRDAFRVGDGYVVVWADDTGRARMYHQDVRNCTVFYNPETGQVDSGAKVWRGVDNYIYLTMYFRDRLEKYITRNPQSAGNMPTTAAAFVKRIPDGEEWPLPNPSGVCPMFHFGLETSILSDVIPLNDALNKTLADLLVSSEANSLRQRWAAGIAFEINPETGKQVIPYENAAQWIASQDPGAKFGQFDQVALSEFLKTAESFRFEVASVAGIPHYYFGFQGGEMPSGEALKKAESRFTATIKDAQGDFGEVWGRVMQLAMYIDGKLPADDKKAELETQWSAADPMSTNEQVDLAIKKKQIGVSDERNLSEIGYTDDDIQKMQEQNAAKAKDAADMFSRTFDAGPQL